MVTWVNIGYNIEIFMGEFLCFLQNDSLVSERGCGQGFLDEIMLDG